MILVTGGTGLVGAHLLYFLTKENIPVRAIHRNESDLTAVKNVFSFYTKEADLLFSNIEWIEANILDIPALTDAFEGITHVYHAAAFISFNPKHYSILKKTNVEGTANIVNLCLSNNIKKLCHVSSVATLGESQNGKITDEETQWNPEEKNNVYAITKFGAEMEVWRGAQEGLNVVMVNPGLILGEGFWNDGTGAIFRKVAKGMLYHFPGGVGTVDIKDVANIMIRLMNSEISNEKYVLIGDNVSYTKLLYTIAGKLGKSAPKIMTPKWFLHLISSLDWVTANIFGAKRKLPKAMVQSLYTNSFYDASKIEKKLDYAFIPFEKTVSRISENYLIDASS